MTDPAQAIRIEACRMTAQILAGSGAARERVLELAALFTGLMLPTVADKPAGQVIDFGGVKRPVNDADKPA